MKLPFFKQDKIAHERMSPEDVYELFKGQIKEKQKDAKENNTEDDGKKIGTTMSYFGKSNKPRFEDTIYSSYKIYFVKNCFIILQETYTPRLSHKHAVTFKDNKLVLFYEKKEGGITELFRNQKSEKILESQKYKFKVPELYVAKEILEGIPIYKNKHWNATKNLARQVLEQRLELRK